MDEYTLNLLKESTHQSFYKLDEMYEQMILDESLNIDLDNTHNYEEISLPKFTKSFKFQDRCYNNIILVYIKATDEIKTGFKIEGKDELIFDYKNAAYSEVINPCADDKVLSTITKIINNEIIIKDIIQPGFHKIWLNPISSGRQRLTDIILNKLMEFNPELDRRGNYLTYTKF